MIEMSLVILELFWVLAPLLGMLAHCYVLAETLDERLVYHHGLVTSFFQ